MGLEHGTCSQFDELFGKQHGVSLSGGYRPTISNGYGHQICLSSVYGDCTGTSLYTGEMPLEKFEQLLPIAIKYAGFNGRITMFFSRKAHTSNVAREIANLRKNNATGITVQYCNRSEKDDYFMITGVIKITNPATSNTYLTWHPDMQTDFNTKEKQEKAFENNPLAIIDDFIEINKAFGIYPFR